METKSKALQKKVPKRRKKGEERKTDKPKEEVPEKKRGQIN